MRTIAKVVRRKEGILCKHRLPARHFDASSDLKEYVAARLAKLEQVYDGITEVRIVFSGNGHPDKVKSAEVIVHVYQQTLTARSDGATHEEAPRRMYADASPTAQEVQGTVAFPPTNIIRK